MSPRSIVLSASVLGILLMAGCACVMPMESSEALTATSGDGTEANPYSGTIVMETISGGNAIFSQIDGAYVLVGTVFESDYSGFLPPSPSSYSVTSGHGLTVNISGLHGTLENAGTIEVYSTSLSVDIETGSTTELLCTFYAVEESTPVLEFLSSPEVGAGGGTD